MRTSLLQRIKNYFLNIVAKYIVWLILGGILIIWWFFPDLINTIGQIVIFWLPIMILITGLLFSFIGYAIKIKRDREMGLTQYDIVITNFEFYIVDLLVYGAPLCIIFAAFLFDSNGVGPLDIIQALICFAFANWLKQLFYNRINE